MVRLVVSERGDVIVGVASSGRGAWIHRRSDCVARAQRKGVLDRAFRRSGLEFSAEALEHLVS